MNKAAVWTFLNTTKIQSIQLNFSHEQKVALWEECNSLMKQATNMDKCYGWYIG